MTYDINHPWLGMDLYHIIPPIYGKFEDGYPLVKIHNYGKSHVLMGKSTINGHVQ